MKWWLIVAFCVMVVVAFWLGVQFGDVLFGRL